jgi:hypothetical protein
MNGLKKRDIASHLLKHGYAVLDVSKDYMGWSMKDSCWKPVLLEAFSLDEESKLNCGAYRSEKGLAIGYRQDETREFFETRLRSNGSGFICDPLLPVENYAETVVALCESLADIGSYVISSISDFIGLDPLFLLELTDLVHISPILRSSPRLQKQKHASCIGAFASETSASSTEVTENAPRLESGKDGADWISSSLIRICSYPDMPHHAGTNPNDSSIAFGEHTDTTFVTVSPCSSYPGLEIFDQV